MASSLVLEDSRLADVQRTLNEYLLTSYTPDCDWIEGILEQRNAGNFDHSNLQKILLLYLAAREKQWSVRVLPKQRVRVAERRYRVPDLVVVEREMRDPVVTVPPLVCIEILSPEDTASDLQDRVMDYLFLNVPAIWVFDPAKRRAWEVKDQGTWVAVASSAPYLQYGKIVVDLDELFRLAEE